MYDSDGEGMIGCDSCSDWFHFSCIGVTEAEAEDGSFNYTCELCKEREKKDRRKFREEQAQEEESEEDDFSDAGSDEPISGMKFFRDSFGFFVHVFFGCVDGSDLDDDMQGDY